MNDFTARLSALVLRLLMPSSGRRRESAPMLVPPAGRPVPPAPVVRPRRGSQPLRGEDGRLVRLYLVTHEARDNARLQRQRRRRALWPAAHGVDVGTDLTHATEVA